MYVFEVISTNLDVNDGYFCNVLFASKEDAISYCSTHLEGKQPKELVKDFEGTLDNYQERSLQYAISYGLPAIYYRSHYGNYRCVVFVRTRDVN